MNEFLDKITQIEREVSAKNGDFDLFALFEPDENALWDVVLSSVWAAQNKRAAIGEVAALLQARLSEEEILTLSGIIVLETHDPIVVSAQRRFPVKHGAESFRDGLFGNLPVARGIIITASDQPTPPRSSRRRSAKLSAAQPAAA